MENSNIQRVYFVGIGGIGMSALARFFVHRGFLVAGYDRTPSPITEALTSLGVSITFDGSVDSIAPGFAVDSTLVIYTPAVSTSHAQLSYFMDNGNRVIKRSQALGELTRGSHLQAVAGTHGKSSTSTMATWFNQSTGSHSAFLGAISKNYGSNMVLGDGDKIVVEADEFDRSFLQLTPDSAVITAADPDHLDIYGTAAAFRSAFEDFISRVKSGGRVIIKQGLDLTVSSSDILVYRYSLDDPSTDYYARNISDQGHGFYSFDLVSPSRVISDCRLGVPGLVNLENSVAAFALIDCLELDPDILRSAMLSFKGIERRFDLHISGGDLVYMDDYAHHPRELTAMLNSVRSIYPDSRITIAFQPHLFSRTQDFYREFASALSLADKVFLLPIYPAREEPIEGVTSKIIFDLITAEKELIAKEDLVDRIGSADDLQVLITAGAGDIDRLVPQISTLLTKA